MNGRTRSRPKIAQARPNRRNIVALIALVILSAPTLAPVPASAQTAYQQIIDRAVASGVPGIQAVVIQGDREWAGTAGLASVERHRAMALGDRIRVASITKMMTYAVIMGLIGEGRLALEDRAASRLPAGTLAGIPHAEDITIGQLLEHQSGIHNFNGEHGADFFQALYSDPRRAERVWTARELIEFAKRPSNPPTGLPGQARSYSSTGYIILEMIAENVTRQPLPELYRRMILAPLGMRQTGFEGDDLAGRDIVDSYGRAEASPGASLSAFTARRPIRPDGLVNLSGGLTYFNAWARGAGAVSSTVCDLGRFMRAVVQGRLTVLRNQDQEFASARARPMASFNWNGGAAGIQASIIYAPANEAVVIVLENGSNAGEGSLDVARDLLSALRAGPAAPDASPVSACAQQGTAASEIEPLQEVVVAYEQAFRTGDLTAFRRAFAPAGSYLTIRREIDEPLGVHTFSETFSQWSAEPDPQSWVTVDEIAVVGRRTALLRLRLHYRGRTYRDQLSLYRLDSRWMIVAKQTEAEN